MSQMSIFDIKQEPQVLDPEPDELGQKKLRAKQLLEAKEYEELNELIYSSAPYNDKKILEYLNDLLPEEHYYYPLMKKVEKYKHEIGKQVICTKFPKHFKGEIVGRQAYCWYVVKNLDDGHCDLVEENTLKGVE